MNSSYSSLDWVLSHWAHFTVPILLCLCLCFFVLSCHTTYVLYYCNTVGWTWWDWSLLLRTFLQCFYTVGWVIWPVKNLSPIWPINVWWNVKPYSNINLLELLIEVADAISSLRPFQLLDKSIREKVLPRSVCTRLSRSFKERPLCSIVVAIFKECVKTDRR